MTWLASIPSPSTGVLELGPLNLSAYGFMIALGAIAGTRLLGRRLERHGWGTSDDASTIAMIAVPAGVIGARLYHVITDWERFDGRLIDTVKIWKGGLGIWGGVAVGVVVGVVVARRRGLGIANTLTAVAPALPLAQAIGRWGNWFNQELFGRPTTLPWGLEIDARHLPDGYELGTLFHPTFLYESLGCLLLVVLLVQLERRRTLRPGLLFLCYTSGYTVLRFFVEGLRIDDAKSAGGLRLNQWTSLVVFGVSVLLLVVVARRSTPAPDAQPDLPAQPD
ncbi:MAG: prolipoprotein diacylglyceryl transferase [Acidimicrobiaceae bacterium]|nr:prolipoprotein diacylglyceryl transferase [Ilumatobacteraceae bacterium]NQW67743.1 prolipoprotein diacylglyceryl transferase [Acidimicrobiaceae bacterium]